MHVRCPVCSTQYEIPPLLRPRRLRCAQCDKEWRESPADPVPAALDPPAEPVPPVPHLPEPPAAIAPAAPEALPGPVAEIAVADRLAAPGRERLAARPVLWLVPWLLSLAVIAGGLAALWHWRGAIGHHWPPSLRLYRLLPGGVTG